MSNSIDNVRFKDDQGYKPIYFKDTLIKLPKVRGDLDYANDKIAQMKKEQTKTSIPPILLINDEEIKSCYNKLIPSTKVKLSCADCRKYDYKIRTHTTFKVKYTLRQRIQIKWRNRLRARFKLVDYKWRKIKCVKCKKVDDRETKKNCYKERKKCNKEKRTCKKKFLKAKRNLKKHKKNRRKARWKSFKDFFKISKSGKSGKKKSSGKSERVQ